MIENDLNSDISNVVDLINIKNLPEIICDYFKDKGKNKYKNLRSYYSTMLNYFGDDIKASYLNRILKYLSSDRPSEIYLIDDINNNIYDEELKSFTKELVDTINKYDDCDNLYESLNRKINFIFYESGKEYCKIKTFNNDKKYYDFIFNLIKHAFKNYQISLPGIFGRSLFIQSQTMNNKNSTYKKFLNASSLLGNDDATISLYCSLLSQDLTLATTVLLRSKENEIVLWSIASDLERNYLSKELIHTIKEKYKYIFKEKDDFINNISVTNEAKKKYYDVTLLMACQLYNYIYKKYDFTKAGNSLGKLLIFDTITYKNNREESIKLAKKYLNREIQKGNINSITNMSIYYYNNPNDNEYDYDDLKRLLKTSASFGDIQGNYYYGRILYDEGKFDEAIEYIKVAANLNEKKSLLLLGQYYELKNDYTNAISSYKNAIINNNYDAAYYLALLYFKLKTIEKDNSLLMEDIGNDYITKYYNLFSEDIKKKAKLLIDKKF